MWRSLWRSDAELQCDFFQGCHIARSHDVYFETEWGNIRLGASLFGPIIASYDKDKFYGDPEKLDDIEKKKLNTVHANGGWGAMNYYVTLEENEEDVE